MWLLFLPQLIGDFLDGFFFESWVIGDGVVGFMERVIIYARTSRSSRESMEASARIAAGRSFNTVKKSPSEGQGIADAAADDDDDDDGDGYTLPFFIFISASLPMKVEVSMVFECTRKKGFFRVIFVGG